MAEIQHEIKIEASLPEVFEALSSLEALKSWHTVEVEGDMKNGGILTFMAPGKPVFRWMIKQLQPNQKLVWECVEGPGDSLGTKLSLLFLKRRMVGYW